MRNRFLAVLFGSRIDFWSIFGSRPGPKMASKPAPAKNSTGILVAENQFFAFSSLGRVPEGSRTDSGGSGDPPAPDFEMILRYFFAASVGILSGFVGFRRDVAGIRIQPQ